MLMFPEGDSIMAGSHGSKGPEQEAESSHQDSEGKLEVRPGSWCPTTYFLQPGCPISPNTPPTERPSAQIPAPTGDTSHHRIQVFCFYNPHFNNLIVRTRLTNENIEAPLAERSGEQWVKGLILKRVNKRRDRIKQKG